MVRPQTWKKTPSFWKQTFIMMINKGGFYIPVAFGLLPDKEEQSYRIFYYLLLQKLSEFNIKINITSITMDYEINVQRATEVFFPQSEILGCYFHFAKCFFRRVELKGMAPRYNVDTNFRTYVKKAMALAELPLDMIDEGFQYLKDYPFHEEETSNFKEYFNNYIESYWFNGCFPPRVWSCWGRSDYRTNNNQEGFNSKLKKDSICAYPAPHNAMKLILKHLRRAEIKKTRNADLQLGQRKKNIYLKMAKHRLRLKKQFQNRGSKEERLKVMGKYMADIASNIVVSALGENAGRSDYKDKGPDNNESMSSVESNVEEYDDPYADMVIGGKRKANNFQESNKRLCIECPAGFNSKSKKVECTSCDGPVHRYHLTRDDDPEHYKCIKCQPRNRLIPVRLVEDMPTTFTCNICTFTTIHKYNLKRHMIKQHSKTTEEAEAFLNDMPKDVAAEFNNSRDPYDVEVSAELTTEDAIEKILDTVGLLELAEKFKNEQIDMETLMTSTALELKSVLNIPFGYAKRIKNEADKQKSSISSSKTLIQPQEAPEKYPASHHSSMQTSSRNPPASETIEALEKSPANVHSGMRTSSWDPRVRDRTETFQYVSSLPSPLYPDIHPGTPSPQSSPPQTSMSSLGSLSIQFSISSDDRTLNFQSIEFLCSFCNIEPHKSNDYLLLKAAL